MPDSGCCQVNVAHVKADGASIKESQNSTFLHKHDNSTVKGLRITTPSFHFSEQACQHYLKCQCNLS